VTVAPDPTASLAAALGRIPSGLLVITYRRGDADAAFLGSWVQQCGFEPPMVSVAVKKGREAAEWLSDGAAFAINVLAEGQKELLSHFGKGLPLEQLPNAAARLSRSDGGAAALTEAHAVLQCRAAGRYATGDHVVVFGHIVAGHLQSEDRPHVHIRKNGLNY
jgi:flavin reductase (DIM6/NTAB) family NADH-FMN oxidoreductase RutF